MFNSLDKKLIFFQNLSVMTGTGMAFSRSLRILAGHEDIGELAEIAAEMQKSLESGNTLTEAMKDYREFKSFGVRLIESGEKGGNLEAVLTQITVWLEHQLRMKRLFLSGIMLPVTIFHAAVFIIPVPAFVLGKITLTGYCMQTIGLLLTLYLLLAGIIYLSSLLLKKKPVRAFVFSVIRHTPVVGGLLSKIDLYRFTLSYSILYQSGIDTVQALKISQDTIILDYIREAIGAAVSSVKSGKTISSGFQTNESIPLHMLNMWKTGEESGALDEMLTKIIENFEDEIQRTMATVVFWIPKFVYLGIIIYIACVYLTMASAVFSR